MGVQFIPNWHVPTPQLKPEPAARAPGQQELLATQRGERATEVPGLDRQIDRQTEIGR